MIQRIVCRIDRLKFIRNCSCNCSCHGFGPGEPFSCRVSYLVFVVATERTSSSRQISETYVTLQSNAEILV